MAPKKKEDPVLEEGLITNQRTYHMSLSAEQILGRLKDQIYAESGTGRTLDLSATLRGLLEYAEEEVRLKGGPEWKKLSARVLAAKNPKKPGAVAGSYR